MCVCVNRFECNNDSGYSVVSMIFAGGCKTVKSGKVLWMPKTADKGKITTLHAMQHESTTARAGMSEEDEGSVCALGV